jgi:hypothetical protein
MKGELPFSLDIFAILSATFVTLSALALWGFATWKIAGKAKVTVAIHNTGDLFWLIGFAWPWFVATFLFLWTLAKIIASWLFLKRPLVGFALISTITVIIILSIILCTRRTHKVCRSLAV